MGWKAFSALSLVILALMVVGTPAILEMTAHSTDDLAVKAGQATPADQDERDSDHYRKKIDKRKNASNSLVINGMLPPAKGGATTYTRIWGDVQPDGTVTVPVAGASGSGAGRLPIDGGAGQTVTYDQCRDANPAATATGLFTCPATAAAATSTTTGGSGDGSGASSAAASTTTGG